MNEPGEKYFSNLSDRERAIFEGGISMGALFHQFTGTPVSLETADGLESAISESIKLQPAIMDVEVHIDREMIRKTAGEFGYVSLTGDMLSVRLTVEHGSERITVRMEYLEELRYPLMYIED
ncbi:dihydroneopterin aldolase family protein [Methanothermobacter thermautotrophicus]|uniref:dihydroneopterin aldolase family protein n=1 Tax=Methanothermobacter thermautotrophicus TaxID=145262 RepID=UPI0022B95577|nr:dihydroneopterin aldolase family protein [Methanothermobacter thermautotrophicus]WBF07386.1 dihydroneopterin aldolase family protein [Methanothermobacter thermautotrophicus]